MLFQAPDQAPEATLSLWEPQLLGEQIIGRLGVPLASALILAVLSVASGWLYIAACVVAGWVN